MTRVELDEYYLLQDIIKECEESIAEAEAQLCRSPAFDLSGVSRNPTPRNHTEAAYLNIIQKKKELQAKKDEFEFRKIRVEEYINGISDLFMRRIFEKRFLQKKRWSDVADELGGRNTAGSVSKMCYRYLKKHPY